jgi:ATP-dependent helicase IRC3
MRLSPTTGKKDCRILDFVDVTTQLNVVSLPSLFGLDPAELADEGIHPIDPIQQPHTHSGPENVQTLEMKSQAKTEMSTSPQIPDYLSDSLFADATITYIDYEDPFSLMNDSSNAPNIFRLSRNAWVGCGDNIYVLPCLQFGDVRIQPAKNDEGVIN